MPCEIRWGSEQKWFEAFKMPASALDNYTEMNEVSVVKAIMDGRGPSEIFQVVAGHRPWYVSNGFHPVVYANRHLSISLSNMASTW